MLKKVPLAVAKWVSDVANGNPQYIELCGALVDMASPPIIVRRDTTPPSDGQEAVMNPDGACTLSVVGGARREPLHHWMVGKDGKGAT
jgi:hypothetical protein